MSPEKTERVHPRAKRFGVAFEEEKAWVDLYRRVGHDATTAAEVLSQLDAEPEMKRSHLALYLGCKESLRRDKDRKARNKRVGQFVRWLCRGLFVRPTLALRRGLRHGRDLVVACLPETTTEPAVARVRHLKRQGEFAQAKAAFDGLTTSSPLATATAEPNAAGMASPWSQAANKVA